MKNGLPLVSIVIPAYNWARYIREAIDSVLQQSYRNIEFIVLDDGSTDQTREILATYALGTFYWETHANMGQASTLNKGWQIAKGDILGYLSADDILLPNAVSTSVNVLQANSDVVLTYCDFNLIDEYSKVIRRVCPARFNYNDMVAKGVCPPGPGAFFRRHAFEAAGPWDSSLRQMPDYDFWLRLGLFGRIQHIPQPLASFRLHNESQTFRKTTESRAEEPIRIITNFFQRQALPPVIEQAKDEALSSAHIITTQLHLRAGRYRAAYASARRAFALFPRNFLRLRIIRAVINGLFYRIGYQTLWSIRRTLTR